jgi:hypothetical protein
MAWRRIYAFPQKGAACWTHDGGGQSRSLHWASAWRLDCADFGRIPLGVLVLSSLWKCSLGDFGMLLSWDGEKCSGQRRCESAGVGKELVKYSERGAEATERVQIPNQLALLAGEEPEATNGSRAPFRLADLSPDRVARDDLTQFPIERATTYSSRYLLGLFVCALRLRVGG